MKREYFIFVIIIFTILLAVIPTKADVGTDKKRLLDYIASLPSRSENRVLSGHHTDSADNVPWAYQNFIVKLYQVTGKWVARIESDYTKAGGGATSISDVNPTLIDYWNQGGLVGLSWSARNPYGGAVRDNKEIVNIDQLLTPGTSVNTAWMGQLDTAASGLQELENAGVVVLWRPFHEMNGDWFWWSWDKGGRISPQQFTRLWRHMFDYLTQTKGLDNLLWVYSPDGQESDPPPSWEKPVMYYYPGNAYVDIVAWDVYDDQMLEYGYDVLVATGKLIIFGEQGPGKTRDGTWDNTILIKAIRERYPKTTSFLAWASWPGNIISLVENRNAKELLNDP